MRFFKKPSFYIRACIAILWTLVIFGLLFLSGVSFTGKTDDKTLNIFTWGGLFTEEVIADFEAATGIKVKMNYYTSNEELIVKLKATKGKGYDLVVPSDYAVKILREESLLQRFDTSQLEFFNNIHPVLLGQKHDPTNEYCIPFQWEIYGFGIDQDFFMDRPFSGTWGQVFNESMIDYKIAMLNDPIEAVNVAAYYLFGPVDQLTEEQTKAVRALLIKQKSWVEAYASLRSDYILATRNCAVALSPSSFVFRTARQFPYVKFVLPKKWSFITIETLAMPKGSDKQELVNTFLNFIFQPENFSKLIDTYCLFPSTTDVIPHVKPNGAFEKVYRSTLKNKRKFYYFKYLIDERETRDIWIEVKS